MFFEDEDNALPAAEKTRRHLFYGEVLFNFPKKFGDSFTKLAELVNKRRCKEPSSF